MPIVILTLAWHAVANRYDDGGFSGGNMERPGLRRLLDDIAAKRVDTLVVYKIDRLTRILDILGVSSLDIADTHTVAKVAKEYLVSSEKVRSDLPSIMTPNHRSTAED